jgi:hypothetical protein
MPNDQIAELKSFGRFIRTTKKPVYITIDPGAKGAIAFLCGREYCVVDIPTFEVDRGKKKKTVFDLVGIVELFDLVKVNDPTRVVCAVEEATVGIPGKGNSAYNGFRVGCSFAMWPLFLHGKGYTVYDDVRPSVWKRAMKLVGKGKDTSRHKAMKLFPGADLRLKKHHDRAEALLMGEYLRRREKERF